LRGAPWGLQGLPDVPECVNAIIWRDRDGKERQERLLCFRGELASSLYPGVVCQLAKASAFGFVVHIGGDLSQCFNYCHAV
jgi:hypothetical protein